MGYKKTEVTAAKGKRISVKLPLSGHNTLIFFEGEVVAISPVDAICWLESLSLRVGDKLKIQVKPIQERGTAFHIECEIVQKNVSQEGHNLQMGSYYFIRFFEVQDTGTQQIQKWLEAA